MALPSSPRILLAGRLSGRKNEVALDIFRLVIPAIATKYARLRVDVIGGPVDEQHRAMAKMMPWIIFHGHQDDVNKFYKQTDIVLGAGRVAMEAMRLKKPVICVGHSCYVGPTSKDNLQRARETNFGDWATPYAYDWTAMALDILKTISNKRFRDANIRLGQKLIKEHYDISKIFEQIDECYADALGRL